MHLGLADIITVAPGDLVPLLVSGSWELRLKDSAQTLTLAWSSKPPSNEDHADSVAAWSVPGRLSAPYAGRQWLYDGAGKKNPASAQMHQVAAQTPAEKVDPPGTSPPPPPPAPGEMFGIPIETLKLIGGALAVLAVLGALR